MEGDIAMLMGLREKFKEIVRYAEEIKTKYEQTKVYPTNLKEFLDISKKTVCEMPEISLLIVREYNSAADKFNQIMKERNINEKIEKIDEVDMRKNFKNFLKYLRTLDLDSLEGGVGLLPPQCLQLQPITIRSKGAIGILESLIYSLPPEERDRLNGLKQQVENIENEKIKQDLLTSIKECEHGFYLGSCLITARVIDYVITKIPGNDINKKIEFLKKSGTEDKDINEFILKGFKKARNYLTHEPGSSASSEDSLFLLAGCVKLVKLLEK